MRAAAQKAEESRRPSFKGIPFALDIFVNPPRVNHVKQKSLSAKEFGHVDIHDCLKHESELDDPKVEMLTQSRTVGKGSIDQRIERLNHHIEVENYRNDRKQTFCAEQPAVEPADAKRHGYST